MRRETNETVCINLMLDPCKRMIFLRNLTIAICLLISLGALDKATAYQLPDSGQTNCYDGSSLTNISCAGTGQDGEYNINPLSYFDNGDGTVTDNNTVLTWQKCSSGQNNDVTCSGTASTYNWYQATGTVDSSSNPAGPNYQNVCGSLNTSNFGGHNDWRLPSRTELAGIVDYAFTYLGPSIDPTYFPNTQTFYYWTSTTGADNPLRKWIVWFQEGLVTEHGGSNPDSYVRCVRGSPAPTQSLTNNNNGTITDSATGLMWERCPAGLSGTNCTTGSAGVFTWADALSFCGTNPPDTHTDWRLPNIRELDSITDYNLYSPALDLNFFPGAQGNSYWSSTPESPDPSHVNDARAMLLTDGSLERVLMTNTFNVRCVRGGINTCPDSSVIINGTPPPYAAIQTAYNNANNGDLIQMQALFFAETLLLSRDNISVTLQGGCDCNFAAAGMTTIRGNLTIGGIGGTVTIANLVIW